jgi:excisionase family DNA binding protein
MEKRYFSISETSEYLTITRVTLYRLVKQGEIPSYKIGGRRIFDKIELDKWVHSKRDKIKKERR